MLAPAQTPRPVLEALLKAIHEAAKAPQLQEAFAKQFVTVKPNESLEEARTWQASELAAWRKITSEIKIDLN
jgi:tripartite-type tricarboxylate transporter receptor subunit TctC